MHIAEIYTSLQGEGFLTGTESIFVRASGCNLRCWFCDTPYTSWRPAGEDLGVPEILKRVGQWPAGHVVITGGEPMLFDDLEQLCEALHGRGKHITIETAGTVYLSVRCDLMSISPKLSNSTPSLEMAGAWRERHERTRHAPDVVRRLVAEYEYQVKFVIDQPADCNEVETYLAGFPEIDRSRVLLMPQGTEAAKLAETGAWLEPYCAEHGFTSCPRKHIEWYGFVRGT
jgi:7-carboxy-7-deazaguanine synthase